jgi:hypothetical protein
MANHGLAVAGNKITSIVKPDLETRVADAFGADLSSKQLSDLLLELAQADEEARASAERANETALDPATRPESVAKARKDMEDAQFRRLRMERATSKLTEVREQALDQERSAARAAEQAAATAERDQLVKDLEEYEELAGKISELLRRLQANNGRLERVGMWIDRAEPLARHAEQSILIRHDEALPALLTGVRLPKFRREGNRGYLWPQR